MIRPVPQILQSFRASERHADEGPIKGFDIQWGIPLRAMARPMQAISIP